MLGLNVIDPVTARYVNEYAERRRRKHGEKHEKKGHHENHDKKGHWEEHSKQTKKDDDGQNQGPEPEEPNQEDEDPNQVEIKGNDLVASGKRIIDGALKLAKKFDLVVSADHDLFKEILDNTTVHQSLGLRIEKRMENLIVMREKVAKEIRILTGEDPDEAQSTEASRPFWHVQAEREQDLKRDPVLYKAWRKATHHEE